MPKNRQDTKKLQNICDSCSLGLIGIQHPISHLNKVLSKSKFLAITPQDPIPYMHTLFRICALLTAALFLPYQAQAAPLVHHWKDCTLKFDGEQIEVGNSQIRRSWQLGETLTPKSLANLLTKTEWISPPAKAMAIEGWIVTHQTTKSNAVEDESLQIQLEHPGNGQKYQIRIFPDTPAIEVEQLAKPKGGPESKVDDLALLDPSSLTFTNVTLKDHTDKNLKGLVFTKDYQLTEVFQTSGNIAYVENNTTHSGILLIKMAPLPHARAKKVSHDFSWNGKALQWIGPGFNSISKRGYPCAVICYSGGRAGRIAASQKYQRSLRRYIPGRDGQLLSNTWGDRSRDAKIGEAFLTREIIAGKKLGVDVMQIDDGWQRGTTQNSAVARSKSGVWSGFWKADPNFWSPHEERLPNGLKPIMLAAREHGLKTGLWYAPDSDDDFGNWERDANRILELYRDHGVTYFKLDSIVMTTEIAEKRVLLLMHKVIEESKGKVVIDLDVTAGVRPGYLGAVSVGTVFVENRYTDWGSYWPHKTLRNFWQLSEFIDPVRLRMEFLNNFRNATKSKKYKGSELAPATYPPSYLFASVMFSSPLAWFEVSELPEKFTSDVTPLIDIWKKHRTAIHQGDIIPIGQVPDGKSWTGLCSIAHDRKSGYAVIFREVNDQTEATFEIPLIKSIDDIEVLHGDGDVSFKDGKIHVSLAQPRSFIFVRF